MEKSERCKCSKVKKLKLFFLFEFLGGDPFKNEHDPFTASVDDAFGGGTLPRSKENNTIPKKENNTTPKKENNTTEPWGAVSSVVSFADDTAWSAFDTSPSKVVVSNNLDDSFDPFSAKNLAPAPGEFINLV